MRRVTPSSVRGRSKRSTCPLPGGSRGRAGFGRSITYPIMLRRAAHRALCSAACRVVPFKATKKPTVYWGGAESHSVHATPKKLFYDRTRIFDGTLLPVTVFDASKAENAPPQQTKQPRPSSLPDAQSGRAFIGDEHTRTVISGMCRGNSHARLNCQ